LQQEVGLTSLYVTHDQAEAMALSDQIVVMNQGKVMQVGSPMEIYRKPANVFVASFIGSPAMNLLNCQIDHQARTLRVEDVASLPFTALRNPDALQSLSQVKLGIRPEHIKLESAPQAESLPATLYVVQELGSETLAVFSVNHQFVAARLYNDPFAALSSQMWLRFQPDCIFVYGPDGALLE
jgi:ABC-type sugar transport system ATPase subunit